MITTDLAVVGGGAAGLAAGIEASKAGAKVLLFDENARPGGQLFKQTHKFFGSFKHYAGIRGFDIEKRLLEEAEKNGVETRLNTIVFEIDGKRNLGLLEKDNIDWLKAKTIVFNCGASEKVINFPGWTLPGVMGAGAAQTIMNIQRVLPGTRFLMVGSGNVGLVVSYQILQAGGYVVALVEALPRIGGYGVHASKIRRAGIPILVSHTIKEAYGTDRVEVATIEALDKNLKLIPGTERTFEIDVVCLAVGLKPKIDLPLMAGCKTLYLSVLGGRVPIHDENMETTEEGIYVAGDGAGVEEASTAIEEGRLAGIAAAEKMNYLSRENAEDLKLEVREILNGLRSGPFGEQRKLAKIQLIQAAKSLR